MNVISRMLLVCLTIGTGFRASAQVTTTQNFDGIANGAFVSTISGWANSIGTTMHASTTKFNSSPNGISTTTANDAVVYSGGGFLSDQTITVAVNLGASDIARIQVRSDGTNQNYYELLVTQTTSVNVVFALRKVVSGSSSSPTLTGPAGTATVANTWYWVKFNVAGGTSSVISAKIWLVGGSEPGTYSTTFTDSSSPILFGYPGVRLPTTSFADDVSITGTAAVFSAGSAVLNSVSSNHATVTVGAAALGVSPYTYQWYRSTTSGFTPGAGNIVTGATSLTLADSGLTNGTTYYYVNVVTDSTSATAQSNQVAAVPGLTPGVASVVSKASGAISVTSTPTTGNSGTLTYQWYRGTDPTNLTAVSGATSLTLNDTGLTNGTPYYYQVVSTDGNPPVSTNIVYSIPAGTVYVGLIGDSWNTTTSSATTSVVGPQAAGNILQQKLQSLYTNGTVIVVNNQGIGGTNGAVWAPGGSALNGAEAAFLAAHGTAGDWTVQIHLGINDSSQTLSTPLGGESVAQYQAYIQATVTNLLSWGAGKVVLVGPPCIGPISTNHTAAGTLLLSQYFGALQAIASSNPGKVYATLSEFNYYAANPSDLGTFDNVHPTPADSNGQGGATNLSTMWASSMFDILNGIGSGNRYTFF